MLSGVSKRVSMELINTIPSAAMATNIIPNKTEKEDNMLFNSSSFSIPYFCAASTEMPDVKPTITVINKLYNDVVAPIPPRANSPSTFPTIKASTQLNIC